MSGDASGATPTKFLRETLVGYVGYVAGGWRGWSIEMAPIYAPNGWKIYLHELQLQVTCIDVTSYKLKPQLHDLPSIQDKCIEQVLHTFDTYRKVWFLIIG